MESQSLYDLLETEIIPLFYDRDDDGLPRGWIKRMKAAMQIICPKFNSTRMVQEYCDQFYTPAAKQYQHLLASGMARAGTPATAEIEPQEMSKELVDDDSLCYDAEQELMRSGGSL